MNNISPCTLCWLRHTCSYVGEYDRDSKAPEDVSDIAITCKHYSPTTLSVKHLADHQCAEQRMHEVYDN